MRSSGYIPAKVLAMLVVLGALMVGLGCEERVVGTRNSWVGAQYQTEDQSNLLEEEEEEKGLGEVLFGWTGLFDDDDSNRRNREITPADRLSSPSQTGGSGSYY